MNSKLQAKPFLKWVGGKTQLLPEISKRMPAHYDKYFEPFLGGGAVFFALMKQNAYLVDINYELINTYCVVRDCLDELIGDLKRHVYDKNYYYNIRSIDRKIEYASWSNVQKASRFIYLNKTCYNALWRVNSKMQFNTPFGRYKNPTILDEQTLRKCSEVLQNNVELVAGDFRDIESLITSKDFIYFDPPYVPLSKTASFTAYSKGGFNENMQRELSFLCKRLDQKGVRFMLSNSSASLVLELYKSFNIEFVKASRAINSQGHERGKISEVIVTNY
ncbi:MAG: DNA adenine methylase [Cyanobacteria bacterium J06558_2]